MIFGFIPGQKWSTLYFNWFSALQWNPLFWKCFSPFSFGEHHKFWTWKIFWVSNRNNFLVYAFYITLAAASEGTYSFLILHPPPPPNFSLAMAQWTNQQSLNKLFKATVVTATPQNTCLSLLSPASLTSHTHTHTCAPAPWWAELPDLLLAYVRTLCACER